MKGYKFVRKNDLIQQAENLKKKKNYIINVKKLQIKLKVKL